MKKTRLRMIGLAIAILAACLTGAAQTNSDRDTNGASKTSASAPPPEARIDINKASIDQLMKTPGMARTWAARIVKYRPYRTKADLVEYGIVSDKVYERIKDYVIAHRDEQ
jgi:DNA uptake protein ComE-like DNA-binding protein